MTNMEEIWEAERKSYRIQFAEEVLPKIKDLIDSTTIVSTHPDNVTSLTESQLYNEIEKIVRSA
jgi:hypothetical protein